MGKKNKDGIVYLKTQQKSCHMKTQFQKNLKETSGLAFVKIDVTKLQVLVDRKKHLGSTSVGTKYFSNPLKEL